VLDVAAFTRVDVLAAVESIKLKRPLPPLVVSIPTVQLSKRKPWPVPWRRLVILTPVPTSMKVLMFELKR
jgi:hypothetical protein